MQKQDFKTYQQRFRDFKILPKFSKPLRFSRYHLPPLKDRSLAQTTIGWLDQGCFKGRFYHSYM